VGLDKIKVHCYSSYTYAQKPVSFDWQGKYYEVENIQKEWLEPGERWFSIKTRDKKHHKLCYNDIQDEWLITKSVKEPDNAKRNT
jgi:hypothetical protein